MLNDFGKKSRRTGNHNRQIRTRTLPGRKRHTAGQPASQRRGRFQCHDAPTPHIQNTEDDGIEESEGAEEPELSDCRTKQPPLSRHHQLQRHKYARNGCAPFSPYCQHPGNRHRWNKDSLFNIRDLANLAGARRTGRELRRPNAPKVPATAAAPQHPLVLWYGVPARSARPTP